MKAQYRTIQRRGWGKDLAKWEVLGGVLKGGIQEPVPAGILQGRLTFSLAAVKPLELREREASLDLDGAKSHGLARRGASWAIKK